MIRLPRVYRDIGIRCPVLSLIATSIFCLGALCSALYRSRFSRSCWACIACFSLLGGKKTQFRLLMIWYSIPFSTKTIDPTAVSANPAKSHSKTPRSRRHEQSIPPIMKNERPKTQRNLLKRVRSRPEHRQLHQIPNWGRAKAPEFSYLYCPKPAAAYMPRRSGFPGVRS